MLTTERIAKAKPHASTGMDPECVSLCYILNRLPGVTTTGSCCGHGKSSFRIWLQVDSMKYLVILGRVLDKRYGCPIGWKLIVDNTDTPESCPCFLLTSGFKRGPDAYSEAQLLVDSIQEHLKHKNFIKLFNIPLPV